jgi:hypothetical protein
MHNSYFHHCANCLVAGAKPLSYIAFIRLVNTLESTK